MGRRLLFFLLVALIIFIAWPSPIDPVVLEPGEPLPLSGALEPNEDLRAAERLADGEIIGPEDVDIDAEGRIYGACEDGRIVRILPDGTVEDWSTGLGRPLGMDFDKEGNLIVCDAVLGLLSIDPKGISTVLVDANGEQNLGFTDDCEIASDGVIYFSDASKKFGVGEYMFDLLEGRPHGRLFAYDPATKETTMLLDDLSFANGIAVAEDDSFVLVNETYRYRITRYWLKGDKKGTSEVFIDNLPGFPDGISSTPRGTFWVAMFTVRNPTADALAGYPWVRAQMAKLPRVFLPAPAEYGFILELDANGNILRSLHDPGGEQISNVTSVHEEDGTLYLGNLVKDYVGRLSLKPDG